MKVYSRAAIFRDKLAELDLPHRKGWKLSEYDKQWPTLEHFDDEVLELKEALTTHDLHNAQWEIADVFVCLLQTATRLGMTFEDLDSKAVHKMSIRFIGADNIDIDTITS